MAFIELIEKIGEIYLNNIFVSIIDISMIFKIIDIFMF